MRPKGVPFYRQSFGREESREVNETIKSGWVTSGRKVQKFEAGIAAYVGAKNAAATNSCTAAMHLLLVAAGIGPGDEVVTTPYTFAATSEAILYTGAKPVYCDIDYDSLNLEADAAARKITKKTKALLPVHIAGLPVHMDKFKRLARGHKIKLFDDAAHALGASYKGKRIGSLGDGTAFSFYATKNLTTGEGGMVTTGNATLYKRVKLLSLHAMSKGAWKRYTKGGSWRYDLLDLGYKYNMPDLNAALGLAQLAKFEKLQKMRQKAARRYIAGLSDLEALRLPLQEKFSQHAWHLFMIRIRPKTLTITRNKFIEELSRKNIGTSVHFIPLFLQKYYRKRLKLDYRDFPNALSAYKEIITLPFFPDLKNAEIDYVCDVIRKLCHKYRR